MLTNEKCDGCGKTRDCKVISLSPGVGVTYRETGDITGSVTLCKPCLEVPPEQNMTFEIRTVLQGHPSSENKKEIVPPTFRNVGFLNFCINCHIMVFTPGDHSSDLQALEFDKIEGIKTNMICENCGEPVCPDCLLTPQELFDRQTTQEVVCRKCK